ncbi:hypothetical protein D3C78_1435290 [compost metagenome]
MIAGLSNRVVDIIKLNDVPAPSAVVYADSCSRQSEYFVMADDIVSTDRDEHAGRLLPVYADIVNFVVADRNFGRVSMLATKRERLRADQTNAAFSDVMHPTAMYPVPPVVKVHEHGISPHRVETAICNLAMLRPFQKDGSSPVDSPVS